MHLEERLGVNRPELLALLSHVLASARDAFTYLSVGFEDASRADLHFLQELLVVAADCGADRVRLADTVGVLSPFRMQALVKLAQQVFPGDIGVHCHNDFGMATANAIAALESGADWADATLLGIGERAGNARLEEVAAYLQINPYCKSEPKNYDMREIKRLCQYLADTTDLKMAAETAKRLHQAIKGTGPHAEGGH